MPKITGLSVQPLVKEWKFEFDETGATGIRKYIDYQGAPPPAEDLPSIGDSWSADFPNCRVKNIVVNYIADNDLCPKIYTVNYETIYVDTQASINDDITIPADETNPHELIIGVETSGELISVNPPSDDALKWKWKGSATDKVIDQPIYFTVNTTTYRFQRMIINLPQFSRISDSLIGKVNGQIFLNKPVGTMLYNGFNATPLRSETDRAKWRCELTFVYRSVTGDSNGDGWNYILKEQPESATAAIWDRPYRQIGTAEPTYLYSFGEFYKLFTKGEGTDQIGEGKDLIVAAKVPLK